MKNLYLLPFYTITLLGVHLCFCYQAIAQGRERGEFNQDDHIGYLILSLEGGTSIPIGRFASKEDNRTSGFAAIGTAFKGELQGVFQFKTIPERFMKHCIGFNMGYLQTNNPIRRDFEKVLGSRYKTEEALNTSFAAGRDYWKSTLLYGGLNYALAHKQRFLLGFSASLGMNIVRHPTYTLVGGDFIAEDYVRFMEDSKVILSARRSVKFAGLYQLEMSYLFRKSMGIKANIVSFRSKHEYDLRYLHTTFLGNSLLIENVDTQASQLLRTITLGVGLFFWWN